MALAAVTRELLVRYLDVWTPRALHAAKRATFAYAYSADPAGDGAAAIAEETRDGPNGGHADTAEAALRVFAEFDDLLRGRRLTCVVVGADAGTTARLDAVQAELGTPANLAVHAVQGDPDTMLAPALSAADAAGAPLLVFDHADLPPAKLAAGRPTELIAALPAGSWASARETLRVAGFALTTAVEFIDAHRSRLVVFATGRATSLEAFKSALWAVDEYAGVRYRDPDDPEGEPQDISLEPHPGPLRRALLDHLAATGPQTVTELRQYALTDTIYRSADATRVLAALLDAGAVASDAAHGRLSGDVVVRPV